MLPTFNGYCQEIKRVQVFFELVREHMGCHITGVSFMNKLQELDSYCRQNSMKFHIIYKQK